MKRLLLAALAAALLASCAGAPQPLADDATEREIVQRAQEASDRGALDQAAGLYQTLVERFGADPAIRCAGEYEIAFIRYKQGRWADSKALLDALLARYAAPGGETLPPRYRILAGKILPKVEEKLGQPK